LVNKKRKRHVLGTTQEKDDVEIDLEQALFGAGSNTVELYGTELSRQVPTQPHAKIKEERVATTKTSSKLDAIAYGVDTSNNSKRRKTSDLLSGTELLKMPRSTFAETFLL